MSFNEEAENKLLDMRDTLVGRLENATGQDEVAALQGAIADINGRLGLIGQLELLDAAATVLDATVALERVLTTVRLDPFDTFLLKFGEILTGLGDVMSDGKLGERLPQTPEDDAQGDPTPDPSVLSQATAPLPPVQPETNADITRPEYDAWYTAMQIRSEYEGKVQWHVNRLLGNEGRYREAGDASNGVPWAVIGVIHAMESSFNFATHLHNGDPLTARTHRVPAGRPDGDPPFSWEVSAADALVSQGLDNIADWSIGNILYQLEKYNGFGYRRRGLPSPYLWSFSDLYVKGKYVADGFFDPDAVSKQCGVAVMLKALEQQGSSLT